MDCLMEGRKEDGCMDGQTDKRIDGQMDRWTDRRMDGRTNRQRGRQGRYIDRWMYGYRWMDRLTDGTSDLQIHTWIDR